jgi:hypothetical protein
VTRGGVAPLRIWSEPFAAAGGIGAKGVKNALGRPTLELSTLLMREAIQNSWDAKDFRKVGPVLFGAQLLRLSESALGLMRVEMFRRADLGPLPALKRLVSSDAMWGLFIYDRGTIGLSGPTWADVAVEGSQNFINFVRNVGQPAAAANRSGGTYGYGKSVLYRASEASTIIVHSRCENQGRTESRLIAAALSEHFDRGGKRYTGRHWWGALDPRRGVDPLRGAAADRWAEELEMPSYEGDELGTTILILGPALGAGDPDRQVVESMAHAAAWHCWPKLVDLGDGPEMEFEFSFEDEDITVPDPAVHPELKHYVAALKDALAQRRGGASGGSDVFDIKAERPKQDLGTLSIRKYPATVLESDEDVRPYHGPSHHVALMRHPKLVVKYVEGPASPVAGTAWAGAFLADPDPAVELAFAASEPPSHDDWSPNALEPKSRERRYVKIAQTRIGEVVSGLFRPVPVTMGGADAHPLAHLGDALGGLIAYEAGPGTRVLAPTRRDRAATGDGGSGAGGSHPAHRRAALEVVGGAEVVTAYGESAVRVTFRVTIPVGGPGVQVKAKPGVAINDGSYIERDPPMDANLPGVMAWIRDAEMIPGSQVLHVDGGGTHECAVLVSIPADTAVAVELSLAGSD